ncbi:hypothetical protein POM88_039244 [Heracleum sosnowskyi]|uniref:Endonuclease/exonuclease/phosphatase domain-containing protein n=1 Tax=Heracleum sosnowskyi TaxID=360622 RepID=A0AAD8HBX1_9APIA|nr:hypothetical protein POM88_039244 [Heracleum sosnowskyi]
MESSFEDNEAFLSSLHKASSQKGSRENIEEMEDEQSYPTICNLLKETKIKGVAENMGLSLVQNRESTLKIISQQLESDELRFIWGNGEVSGLFQGSEGLSGGLAIIWDSSIFNCLEVSSNRNLIWANMVEFVTGSEFHCINVYMPNSNTLRQEVFSSIKGTIMGKVGDFFIISGDFNSVRSQEERSQCLYRDMDSIALNNFIYGCC